MITGTGAHRGKFGGAKVGGNAPPLFFLPEFFFLLG